MSNRFCQTKDESEFKHHFALGLCHHCGLVQQLNPFPVGELRPQQSWVKYCEPEGHLDAVAEMLEKKLFPAAKICALSYKDQSLLERMKEKRFGTTLLSPQDLGLTDTYAGVDVVQQALTLEQAQKIALHHGKFDLIIARHILEHSYDLEQFTSALRELLNPGGMILFEVPDYARSFEARDYSTLWEEHLLYFTPATLTQSLELLKLSLLYSKDHFLPLETCLIALVKPDLLSPASALLQNNTLIIEEKRAEDYARDFPLIKKSVRDFISSHRNTNSKIAVYGAGHAAVMLVNLFELHNCVDFVIDDNPLKRDLFMPGSRLPIVSSTTLQDVDLCAFSLNPETEPKIIQNQKVFTERGGVFVSLTPGSPLYLLLPSNNNPLDFIEKSIEVIQATNEITKVRRQDLQVIKDNATRSSKLRSRICAHKSSTDKLHEMIITLNRGSYIRPHRHAQKAESFHIIEGLAYVVIFEDNGAIADVIALGDYHSQRNFYYRVDAPLFHTVVVLSDQLVFHETTTGPFNKEETIVAAWSPAEEDLPGQQQFLEKLMEKITFFLTKKAGTIPKVSDSTIIATVQKIRMIL